MVALLWAVFPWVLGNTASAQDNWSEPNPGLRYLHRTTEESSIHALVVDLREEGVRIETTPYDDRWTTVSEYATTHGTAAALNGGFWDTLQQPAGLAAGGGLRWPRGTDTKDFGFFSVGSDGRAWISMPELEDDTVAPRRVRHAVSGRPCLVRAGHVDTAAISVIENGRLRQPRTAVGVSRDGRTVVLVVVDGRQSRRRGLSLPELALLFVELGAHDAINLDGGGSSAMFLVARGGIVNAPSGGRWEASVGLGVTEEEGARVRKGGEDAEETFVRGIEREVMNHIGVFARAPIEPTQSTDEPSATSIMPGSTAPIVAPRPPFMRLGQAREVVIPGFYFAAALAPILIALWFIARRRQRQRRLRTS